MESPKVTQFTQNGLKTMVLKGPGGSEISMKNWFFGPKITFCFSIKKRFKNTFRSPRAQQKIISTPELLEYPSESSICKYVYNSLYCNVAFNNMPGFGEVENIRWMQISPVSEISDVMNHFYNWKSASSESLLSIPGCSKEAQGPKVCFAGL